MKNINKKYKVRTYPKNRDLIELFYILKIYKYIR